MGKGLEYLNSLADWRGSKQFDLGKMRSVLSVLDNPQDRVPVVHIGGTNGKGSVSAAISAVLAASGAHVGLNISPHLQRINERVVIGGSAVGDDWLSHFACEVEQAAERVAIKLSFHEAITATAYHGFFRSGLDWAVMEVGLGGTVDASNVVAAPRVTSIVSIDYDHQHILGPTLRDIARHKAGIIKTGVPLVTGPLPLGAEDEIDRVAGDMNAPRMAFGKDFVVEDLDQGFRYRSTRGEVTFHPSLRGPHQGRNMGVVLALAEVIGISHKNACEGISNVFWPGRLEHVRQGRKEYLLDCAHNPAGIRELVRYVRERFGSISVAFGALTTKAWPEMIDLLAPVVTRWNILRPNSHLAVDPKEVVSYLSGLGIKAINHQDDYEGFLELANRDPDPLLVTGSIYMLGQLRERLVSGPIQIWPKPTIEETAFDKAV